MFFKSLSVTKRALAIGILLVALPFAAATCTNVSTNNSNQNSSQQQQKSEATIVVTKSSTDSASQKYEIKENETAYDLLKRMNDEGKMKVEFSSFEFSGKTSYFITSINDTKPDATKQFWKFVVNGKDSQVGISDYIVKTNDNLSFIIDNIQ